MNHIRSESSDISRRSPPKLRYRVSVFSYQYFQLFYVLDLAESMLSDCLNWNLLQSSDAIWTGSNSTRACATPSQMWSRPTTPPSCHAHRRMRCCRRFSHRRWWIMGVLMGLQFEKKLAITVPLQTNDAFMDVLKHLGYESTGFWIGLGCDEEGLNLIV